jgi:hypothetical protein
MSTIYIYTWTYVQDDMEMRWNLFVNLLALEKIDIGDFFLPI